MDASSAVVFWLFPKPVNLPQETVGYQLTLIQSSNLYFSLIHVILLELNHCCDDDYNDHNDDDDGDNCDIDDDDWKDEDDCDDDGNEDNI